MEAGTSRRLLFISSNKKFIEELVRVLYFAGLKAQVEVISYEDFYKIVLEERLSNFLGQFSVVVIDESKRTDLDFLEAENVYQCIKGLKGLAKVLIIGWANSTNSHYLRKEGPWITKLRDLLIMEE